MSFTRDDNNRTLTCRALHPTGDQFDSVKLDIHCNYIVYTYINLFKLMLINFLSSLIFFWHIRHGQIDVPILSITKSTYSVKEGSELKIECQVDANPPVTAYWKRKNGKIFKKQKIL